MARAIKPKGAAAFVRARAINYPQASSARDQIRAFFTLEGIT